MGSSFFQGSGRFWEAASFRSWAISVRGGLAKSVPKFFTEKAKFLLDIYRKNVQSVS